MMEDRYIEDRVGEDRVGEDRVAARHAAGTAGPDATPERSRAADESPMPSAPRDPLSEDAAPAAGRPPLEEVPAEAAGRAPLDEDAMPAAASPTAASPTAASPGQDPSRLDPDPVGAPAEPVGTETLGSPRNPGAAPLMGDQAHLRETLQDIQATFVDDPSGSVRRAADLAENTVETLLERVRQQTRDLRASWDGREESREPDTETLRNALRSYRVFIDRLAGV
ncbi:MAG: hypothetical protein ACM3ML_04740 [Micromonosporaceae bacterium]